MRKRKLIEFHITIAVVHASDEKAALEQAIASNGSCRTCRSG
jgi:hypothetical protein